jgi:3-oxo-5-alpha-steroid 4-dehydrogenase 1
MIEVLIYGFILIFIYFLLFYLIALRQGIYNTVDIAYGTGFILVSLLALFLSDNFEILRKIFVTVLIILWGIRIATFLTFRKYGKDEITNEDKRFKIMRDRWEKSATWKGFVFLYLPQVFIVLIVALPVLVINYYSSTTDLTLVDLIGVLIVFIGVIGETISDFQLNQFKKNLDNKGKVYTGGLWKYSQHPNYFFEIVT